MVLGSLFDDTDLASGRISSATRRVLIAQYLESEDSLNYSGRAILKAFRDVGLGIGTGDFYSLYREVRGLSVQSEHIQRLGDYTVPTHDQFALSRYNQKSDYKYIVDYTYFDHDKQEWVKKGLSVDTDFRMSKADVYEQFENILGENYPVLFENIASFHIVRAFRRF